MLIPIKFLLDQARAEDYGFLRVAVSNSEEIEAVLTAAEEVRSPIGFSVNEPELEFPRYRSFESLIIGAAAKAEVPVCVQFDHTDNMTLILRAIRGGYNGIMVDASHCSFKENVEITKKVVDMCHPLDIFVEGEVGTITHTRVKVSEDKKKDLTDPDIAKKYVNQTRVDALAVAIGEVSGFSGGNLDFDRLKKIKAAIRNNAHLCLHGVSFIADDDIKRCIAEGITYYGCAAEIHFPFFKKLDEVRRREGEKMIDQTRIYGPAREAMKKKVIEKVKLLGSAGKAHKLISDYFSGNKNE